MRHLLDAHSLIWALDDPSKLGRKAVAALEDPANELLVGAGTVWELSIKISLGKLSPSGPYGEWMPDRGSRLLRSRSLSTPWLDCWRGAGVEGSPAAPPL